MLAQGRAAMLTPASYWRRQVRAQRPNHKSLADLSATRAGRQRWHSGVGRHRRSIPTDVSRRPLGLDDRRVRSRRRGSAARAAVAGEWLDLAAHTRAVLLAATLVVAPLGAQGADLVVWWEKGQYDEEDQAVREIVAAFEQKTDKEVELVLEKHEKLRDDTLAAIKAGRPPPDFIFTVVSIQYYERWAYEGRLVELSDAIGPMREM